MASSSATVVTSSTLRYGRNRMAAGSLRGIHHRPEKRQAGGSTFVSVTTTGFGHTASTAATMAASSCGVGGLERDVGMLPLGELLPLGAQQVEALHQYPTGLGGVDHVVDIAPLGGHVGIGV